MTSSSDESALLEFHDSVVVSIQAESDDLTLRLSPGIIHRSRGNAGVDPGTCWTQAISLIFSDARLSGALPAFPLSISDATMRLGMDSHRNSAPIPLDFNGPVTVDFQFEDGSTLNILAGGVELRQIGSEEFLQDFSGLDSAEAGEID